MVEAVETELERSGRVEGFGDGDSSGRWIGMWYWDIVGLGVYKVTWLTTMINIQAPKGTASADLTLSNPNIL